MVSIFRLIYLTPQTATWISFSTPIPKTLYLVRFGFRPENFEKRLKTLNYFLNRLYNFNKNSSIIGIGRI